MRGEESGARTGNPSTTSSAAASTLCDFFVAATHAITYMHGCYPERTFSLRNKYGLATMYNRDADVCAYIANLFTDVHAWVAQGLVERVVIAVRAVGSRQTAARYVYDVQSMGPAGGGEGARVVQSRHGNRNEEAAEDAEEVMRLTALLRAHLQRLLVCDVAKHAGAGGEETTFDVVVHTTGVGRDERWMPAHGAERCPIEGAVVEPLKDADDGFDGSGLSLAARVELPGRSGARIGAGTDMGTVEPGQSVER